MFEMRFQGLITHALVDDPSRNPVQRAVLYVVTAMPHTALLTVSQNDLVQGTPDFPPSGDARCFLLNGKTTIPSGLAAGIPSTHLTGVVSLNDPNLTTGSILKPRSEIGASTPISNVFHLMEIPEGTLAVHNWFRDQALFNSNIYPMSRTVVFTSKASGNVTFSIVDAAINGGQARTVIVKPDAVVYISNFPDDDSMPMPHFEVEASFFDQTANTVTVNNPTIIKSPAFPLGSDDDPHDTCAVTHELSVECSNSRFP